MPVAVLMQFFQGRSKMATNVSAWAKTLTLRDFTATANGMVTNTSTWLMYRIKVGAQQAIRFGTGAIVGGVDDRGILYVSIKDNSNPAVQVNGRYRLSYMDANENIKSVIKEGYLDQIRTSKVTRDAGNVLAEMGLGARQDSYLVLEILPDTGSLTISDANSDFQIPVTIYTAI